MRLTVKQREVLNSAGPSGVVSGHKRTLDSLMDLGLIESVRGWYEKSVAHKVGRARATTRTWGVIGYRITDAGRHALNAEKFRRFTS